MQVGTSLYCQATETGLIPHVAATLAAAGTSPDEFLESFGVALRFQDLCTLSKGIRLYYALGNGPDVQSMTEVLDLLRGLQHSEVSYN